MPENPIEQEGELTQRILEAQADLQFVLGILRMEIRQAREHTIVHHNLGRAEERATDSLKKLHELLANLGTPMYSSEHER